MSRFSKKLAFVGNLDDQTEFRGMVEHPAHRKMSPKKIANPAALRIAGILRLAKSPASQS